ncbi:DUF4262 domain-containing protein [Gordonia sp. CPCC 205515]|uniref:DUF4262 domain-containing protein n=1 Tax=Gordonia sp. CPCC 205515 TaxID=3140791 RepID=UPI003AF38397
MSDHTSAIRGLRRWHPNPLVRETIATIRSYGWAITAISEQCTCGSPACAPPDCSFAYTTGATLHSLPELAVYGLDAQTSCDVLNELVNILHHHDWHELIDHRIPLALESFDLPIHLIEMIDKDDLLITNELFPNAPALQVVWPDDYGSYPWEEEYSLDQVTQLLKGVVGTGAERVRGRRVILRNDGPNRAERRVAARKRR